MALPRSNVALGQKGGVKVWNKVKTVVACCRFLFLLLLSEGGGKHVVWGGTADLLLLLSEQNMERGRMGASFTLLANLRQAASIIL